MLNRVLWVTDSDFNSETNRACLQRGGEHYSVCEKLRSASADAKKALARPGRYHLVEGTLSGRTLMFPTPPATTTTSLSL